MAWEVLQSIKCDRCGRRRPAGEVLRRLHPNGAPRPSDVKREFNSIRPRLRCKKCGARGFASLIERTVPRPRKGKPFQREGSIKDRQGWGNRKTRDSSRFPGWDHCDSCGRRKGSGRSQEVLCQECEDRRRPVKQPRKPTATARCPICGKLGRCKC